MTDERIEKIEEMAKRLGLSFASAKAMLEEIESDYDGNEAMSEVWY